MEGLLIAARTTILEQMQCQGIVPKHPSVQQEMKLAMETTVLLQTDLF